MALFRKRIDARLKDLTLGLYLEALWVVGADARDPAFNPTKATVRACVRLCDTLLAERPKRYHDEAVRALAGQLWAVMMELAAKHETRARAKVESVERALGQFLGGDKPVTMERVLYSFDPTDADVILHRWPMWRALEYLGVRAVEMEYRETERKLARTN